MKIMKIDIIFIVVFLGWIDISLSRSAVKGRVKSRLQNQTNTKKLSLDLSSDGPDPSALISQVFKSTLKELNPKLRLERSVSIFLDVTAPPGSREQYVENIEGTLRRLLQQLLYFPMQGFIRTRLQSNDDGTIASITFAVSILSSTHPTNKDIESVKVDLSKPGVDIIQILRTVLSTAIRSRSDNGNQTNQITLEIIPPQGMTKANVHKIIGAIESILITLLPNTEFSIKASVSENSDGVVTHVSCCIKIGEMESQNGNLFSYNIDITKMTDSLDRRIVNILKNIQRKVEIIFNERKPVFLNLKIKPTPRCRKQNVIDIINTIMSTLNQVFPNRIELTVNVYENSRRDVNFLILDIIIEPKNAIEIDLTVLDNTAVQQITYEILKLKSDVINRQPVDKATSFTLILQPPSNADEKIIENITNVVISTISRIFPENEIKVQAETTKNINGKVSKITLVITIEPNPITDDKKEGDIIYIDLSKSGDNLTQQLTKILPNLKTKLNKEHPEPVTVTLSIEPPEKSTELFIRKTLTTILVTLSENFPQDRIKSEATAEENPEGYLKNVKLIFTITPSTSPQGPMDSKVFDINLTYSKINLVQEIKNILPKLNSIIENDHTAYVNLKIQPPEGANEETIKNIIKCVITTVSQIYPYNKLEFQVEILKSPQGTIDNVSILLIIAPTKNNEIKNLPEVFNLNLTSPGNNLVKEIVNILPILKSKITEKEAQNIPVRVHLNIEPPSGVTTDYVKRTGNSVLTIISKLFPQNRVSVRAKIKKNPTGKITEITLIISIEPKLEEPNTKSTPKSTLLVTDSTTQTPSTSSGIDLDLSKPGTNITEEISTALIKIKKVITSKQKVDKTVTFTLNVQPPTGSTQQFVDNTVNTLLTTLTTLFPNNRIEVNMKIFRNPENIITKVTLFLVISPLNVNPETETTTENVLFTTPIPDNGHKVELDLTKPGTNIAEEVKVHILKIKSEVVKNNLPDRPVSFNFIIQPPKGSKEEYVKKTVNIIMTTLADLFPNERIMMQLRIIKNPDGSITTITMVLNIEPTTNTQYSTKTTTNTEETTPTTSRDKSVSTPKTLTPIKINVDVSKPDTNIVQEIVKILPQIRNEVVQKQPKSETVELEFNIEVPDESTEESVQTTVNTILKILKTVYPDNHLEYNVKVFKDEKSRITNITVIISIEPTAKTKHPFMFNLFTTENVLDTKTTTLYPNRNRPTTSSTITHIFRQSTSPNKEERSRTQSFLTTTPIDENIPEETTVSDEEVRKLTSTPASEEIIKSFTTGITSKTETSQTLSTDGSKEPNTFNEKRTESVTTEPRKELWQTTPLTEESTLSTSKKYIHSGMESSTTTSAGKITSRKSSITPNEEVTKYEEFTTSSANENTPSTITSATDEIISKKYTFSNEFTSPKGETDKTLTDSTTPPQTFTTIPSTKENPSKESTRNEEEITKLITAETISPKQSSTIIPSIGKITTRKYTLFDESTTPNEEKMKLITDETRPQNEPSTVGPSTGDFLTKKYTTSEEITVHNEEMTKFITAETIPQEHSSTVTSTSQIITKQYTSSEESTEPNEEITKSITGKTTSGEKSTELNRPEEFTTMKEKITKKYTTSEESTEPNEEITKLITAQTTPRKQSSTVIPSKDEITTKKYTSFEEYTAPNDEITKSITGKTRSQDTTTAGEKSTESNRPEESTMEEKITKKYTTSEESTVPNEEVTKAINGKTRPQETTTSGEKLTESSGPEKSTRTEEIITKKHTTSEETTAPNEEITKSITAETTHRKQSSTVIPYIGEITTKKYTALEEPTTPNEEITQSITGKTRPEETTANEKSTESNRPEESTRMEEKITKKYITSEESTVPNEEVTKAINGKTRPQETTTSGEKLTESSRPEESTRTQEIITERYTTSEETIAPNEEITKSISAETTHRKQSSTVIPYIGGITTKKYTALEESTTPNEEITKYITDKTRPQETSAIGENLTESSRPEGSTGIEERITKKYTTSEESTIPNEEITKSITDKTKLQETTTSGESLTESNKPKESTKTQEIITKKYTTIEESTVPNEEKTKSFTAETTPRKQSTVIPSKDEVTTRQYTSFEESTAPNEEITKSIIGKTSPQETTTSNGKVTKSNISRQSTSIEEEITKEYTTFEKATVPNEKITKSITAETRPQEQSSTVIPSTGGKTAKKYTSSEESTTSNEEITNSITTKTRPEETTTSSEEVTEPNTFEESTRKEEVTKWITAETKPQKQSSTIIPSTGGVPYEENIPNEEFTPLNEEITKYFTDKARPQKKLSTTTPSTFEFTISNEEVTEFNTEKTIPQKSSSIVTPSIFKESTTLSTTEFSSEKSTKPIEELRTSVTQETRAREESYSTTTPSRDVGTSEKFNIPYEERTKSTTVKTWPFQESIATPSTSVTRETVPQEGLVWPSEATELPEVELTPEGKSTTSSTISSGEITESVTGYTSVTSGKTPSYIKPQTVTVEPISTTNGEEITTINIDLSKPGTNLENIVEEIIPSILPNITPKLKNNHPVHLSFEIKPPSKSTQSFLEVTTETLVNVLTKVFPNDQISVKIKAEKNPQGYLTEITVLIIIEPSTNQKPQTETVDIDLSRPGSSLSEEITRILPNILPNVTTELSKKTPVTVNFMIKPPNGATENYLQTTIQFLGQILTKYFPENSIKVQTNAQKNPQGYLTEIIVYITIEPINIQAPRSEDINIDLSRPGVTLVTQIDKILPDILPNIQKSLNDKQPVILSFRIKPRPGMTQSYIPVTSQLLESILTQYFPNNKISVNVNAEKNPQGYLTVISIEITIEPPSTQNPENIQIDLTKPGTTLVNEVREIVPSILHEITEKTSKKLPATLYFKIKPPTGSTESYVQEVIEPLEKILLIYFPNNKINFQIKAQKSSLGHLTEITIEVIIEPSEPDTEKVDIDLSKPGTSLTDQVNIVMPGILSNINDALSKQHPVSLNFTIKPPTGSTENYLQVITESLQNILKKYFPSNKINIQIRANKNPQGYITIIMINITVQPPEKSTSAVEILDIDLTKAGDTLINQVKEKIPYILKNSQDKLSKNQAVTLDFKIKPPPGSTESYLQILANSLVTILTTYFPNNKISVQLNAEKSYQGYLTDVSIEIFIQPPSTMTPDDSNVDIDLTKPGVTVLTQMEKILPSMRQNIAEQLAKNHPVTLSFKVKPPNGSTESYLQVLTKSVQSILMKYFPNSKITIEISAQKDSQNYIKEVIIEINIKPTTTQPPDEEDVDIDLSKPGVTLTNQITRILPNILPNITKDLSLAQPVTVSFKIKPPPRATERYLQVTAETVETLLAKYFPESHINVEISAQKNSQNQLVLITLQITIQPSTTQITKKQNVLIDLTKPGVNLIDQLEEYLRTLSPNVTAKIANGESSNITVEVKPPYESTDSYIQIIVESVIPVLKRIFPNNKVNLETSANKDSRGYVTEILLVINIQAAAKPQDYNIDIDLITSRFTLVEQIDNIIPNILQKLKNDLINGESVTLTFKVRPPNGSKQNYLQTLTQDLVPILTKFFPANRMSIKSSAEKNSKGFLISITVEITIEASVQPKKIDIDLSRPRTTLQAQVSYILPKILSGLKADLSQGRPITLSFNVRPPANSNRTFLNQVANQLVVLLPKYFPKNRMSIKTSSSEDANGFISDIILLITIQP